MKKFFRTLALVLALTLVIGTIPAAAADEVKPLTKKTLYIGGAQGTNADGKQSTYKAKVALYKLAGYKTKADAEGVAISAVAADEKVRVTKSYVYAEELGKTNVTLTVDGVESSVAITVKKNAEAVKVVGLEEGEVVVGTTVEFSLPRKGSDTDARRVTVNGTALDDIEGKDRCYSYKFEKAGEYEFVLEAFQSKYYPVATAKETVKVTVVEPTVVGAKPVASNKVAVTFDCDVTNAITKASFVENCVYTKLVDLQITAGLIKDVKIEKEVATVELYQNFAENTEYFVSVAGQETSFKSAKNDITLVDHIKVEVATPYVGEAANITVKYFNADGVELSLADAYPTIKLEDEFNTDGYITGGKLYMYKADKSATVIATLDIGYDPDTYATQSKTDSVTVVSVNKAAAAKTNKVYSFGGDATKEIHTIRMGADPAVLSVQYTLSDNTKSGFKTSDSGYSIKVSDEKIAMVQSGNTIIGVTEGNTVVIISDADGKVVEALPITVASKNKAKSATIAFANNKETLNLGITGDSASLEIKVYDENGAEVAASHENNSGDPLKYTVEVKQLENTTEATGLTLVANKQTFNDSTITGNARDKAVSVKFTVTVKDVNGSVIASKNLALAVGNYRDGDSTLDYTYTVKATKNALDSSLKYKADGDLYEESVITVEKTFKGFTVKNSEDFILIDDISKIPNSTSGAAILGSDMDATGKAINFLVWKTPEKAESELVTSSASAGLVGFVDCVSVGNLKLGKRQATGNFIATGFRANYDANGNLAGRPSIGSQTVTVSKSDAPVTFTIIDGKRNAAAAVETGKAVTAYKVSWCDKDSQANDDLIKIVSVKSETDAKTGNVYVYSIDVEVKANIYEWKTVTVPVNDLFYK